MRQSRAVSSSSSPGFTSRLGLIARPLTWTRPPLTASAARARVLSRRAAQSHLSTRTGSSTRATLPPLELDTPHGPARVHLHAVDGARAALVLGHGAGGGVGARDLQAAREEAVALGITVALVEQPYLVAGRRSPAPAHQLDAAWIAVVDQLRFGDVKLLVGGRSSGARVACRTAAETGAAGVLCLAFPVHAPGKPEKTRLPELAAGRGGGRVVGGGGGGGACAPPPAPPPAAGGRGWVFLRGNHSLSSDMPGLRK